MNRSEASGPDWQAKYYAQDPIRFGNSKDYLNKKSYM